MSTMTDVAPVPATRTTGGRSKEKRRERAGALLGVLAWVIGVLFVAPILWMLLTSFHTETDAATNPPSIAAPLSLQGYREFFGSEPWPSLLNSMTASLLSTVIVLLLAIPAAYALSIRPVEKVSDVLFFFISTKMLPVVAVIVPIYVVAGQLRVLDNIWTLVVLYTAMNLPIAVWMMRSFFLEVPGEVLEAASVDGAGLMRTLRSVLIPMVAPGIAATALICVIFAWNEFFFALNLTASRAATVPVLIVSTMTSEGLFLARLCAAALLASLPVILAGWIAQKQLVRGLSMGAIK